MYTHILGVKMYDWELIFCAEPFTDFVRHRNKLYLIQAIVLWYMMTIILAIACNLHWYLWDLMTRLYRRCFRRDEQRDIEDIYPMRSRQEHTVERVTTTDEDDQEVSELEAGTDEVDQGNPTNADAEVKGGEDEETKTTATFELCSKPNDGTIDLIDLKKPITSIETTL